MKIFIMRPKIVSIVTAGCSPVDQQQYAGCGSSRERPGRTESGGCRWDGTVRSSSSSSSSRRVLQSSAVQCQLINIDRHGHTTDRRRPDHACMQPRNVTPPCSSMTLCVLSTNEFTQYSSNITARKLSI